MCCVSVSMQILDEKNKQTKNNWFLFCFILPLFQCKLLISILFCGLKVPLLRVMKGSYFGFGSPQQQVDMHARSKIYLIFL